MVARIGPEGIVKSGFGRSESAAFAGAIHADGSAVEIDQPQGCGPSAL
jgi:hypothetical protein